VIGELLKKWEKDIVYLSDYDPIKEREIRRMDIYSFYFRILDQKERQESQNKKGSNDPFGKSWP
jgi:hypothetical protein